LLGFSPAILSDHTVYVIAIPVSVAAGSAHDPAMVKILSASPNIIRDCPLSPCITLYHLAFSGKGRDTRCVLLLWQGTFARNVHKNWLTKDALFSFLVFDPVFYRAA
jgi:hypothetical protein